MLKKTLSAISLIALIAFSACEEAIIEPQQPEEEQPKTEEKSAVKTTVIQYNIPAGQHESDQASLTMVTADTLSFKAKLDNTAIYKTSDPANQADINKLYGLSDCGSFHHVNSARFGWRWFNEKLEIWAYTYYNGTRNYTLVGNASLNVFHEFEIIFTEKTYRFRLNDKTVELPRYCSGSKEAYKLFPYFGGDEVAPHNVSIWIEDLSK